MVNLESLHPYILPEVIGAPIPAVNLAIIRSAREFCERSLVWEHDIPAVPVASNVGCYQLSLPSADLIHLTSVKLDGIPVPSLSDASTVGCLHYMQPDLEHIELVPVPEIGSGYKLLELRAALKPSRNANEISEFLFNEWAEAIAFGAMSILKRQRQSWSDPQGAIADRQEFERKMSEARNRALHGHVKGSVSVRRIPFGGCRG